jgi:hypothetical protein
MQRKTIRGIGKRVSKKREVLQRLGVSNPWWFVRVWETESEEKRWQKKRHLNHKDFNLSRVVQLWIKSISFPHSCKTSTVITEDTSRVHRTCFCQPQKDTQLTYPSLPEKYWPLPILGILRNVSCICPWNVHGSLALPQRHPRNLGRFHQVIWWFPNYLLVYSYFNGPFPN